MSGGFVMEIVKEVDKSSEGLTLEEKEFFLKEISMIIEGFVFEEVEIAIRP